MGRRGTSSIEGTPQKRYNYAAHQNQERLRTYKKDYADQLRAIKERCRVANTNEEEFDFKKIDAKIGSFEAMVDGLYNEALKLLNQSSQLHQAVKEQDLLFDEQRLKACNKLTKKLEKVLPNTHFVVDNLYDTDKFAACVYQLFES